MENFDVEKLMMTSKQDLKTEPKSSVSSRMSSRAEDSRGIHELSACWVDVARTLVIDLVRNRSL